MGEGLKTDRKSRKSGEILVWASRCLCRVFREYSPRKSRAEACSDEQPSPLAYRCVVNLLHGCLGVPCGALGGVVDDSPCSRAPSMDDMSATGDRALHAFDAAVI